MKETVRETKMLPKCTQLTRRFDTKIKAILCFLMFSELAEIIPYLSKNIADSFIQYTILP